VFGAASKLRKAIIYVIPTGLSFGRPEVSTSIVAKPATGHGPDSECHLRPKKSDPLSEDDLSTLSTGEALCLQANKHFITSCQKHEKFCLLQSV